MNRRFDFLFLLCYLTGCATDQPKVQTITPENGLCKTTILPITPKKEDKDACLIESHHAAQETTQKYPNALFGVLGVASILVVPALLSHVQSTCDKQMKTCLEAKGYKYPK